MFKLSVYSEMIPGGVFSYATGGFVGLRQDEIERVVRVEMEGLPVSVRKQLMANEVIVPLAVDEAALTEERLLAKDKLTVLVRGEGVDFWGDVGEVVRRNQISQVSVVFINRERGEVPELGVKEIRFFVVEDEREPGVLYLSALKGDGSRELLLRQVGPRRMKYSGQASTIVSDYRYGKELPLSGLVVDSGLMGGDWRLHEKCRSCRMLASCGGYGEQAVVRCPAFAGEAGEAVSVGSSAGVSNSLTLNESIGGLFDQMVAVNASAGEIVLLDYLAYEYHKAFHFSRTGRVRLAAAIFGQMDAVADRMDGRGFAWKWIQTHAASTKSYLAFKTGGHKKAIAITEEAIGYAVSLLSYPSSPVMTLFISQMLLNKAKVLLTVKDYAGWEEVMLSNIHYLANLEAPAECSGMDMAAFGGLDVGLRHWMLMEVIGQVLKFNLTNRHLTHGDRLIARISANREDALFDEQLRQWVRLLRAVERRDEGFVSACLPAFMASRNPGVGIGALQGYVKTRARKMIKLSI
ncbi:MAG: hypothetical protein JST68_18625 [Bacteroidetes bacterium]|nr:hypothetical protein [Bacteroidota bacterium]